MIFAQGKVCKNHWICQSVALTKKIASIISTVSLLMVFVWGLQAFLKEKCQDPAHNPNLTFGFFFLSYKLPPISRFLRIERSLRLKVKWIRLMSPNHYSPFRSLFHTHWEKWSGTLLEINTLKQWFLVLVLQYASGFLIFSPKVLRKSWNIDLYSLWVFA